MIFKQGMIRFLRSMAGTVVGKTYSRQLNAALVRGAATALNKEWGIMITWAYQQPPYMEPGPELYDDMVSAYRKRRKIHHSI